MKKAMLLIVIIFYFICPTHAFADQQFSYGRHYPNGNSAVSYLYGSNGTFRNMVNVNYPFSLYKISDFNNFCNLNGRLIDINALIANSTGTNQSTAPDKDCHVLLDTDSDGLPNSSGDGNYAFQEHLGYGQRGILKGSAFNQFWFDDNWVARYVAIAYGRQQPYGLYAPLNYNRWSLIGGDTSFWSLNKNPYVTSFLDHRSFRGLYEVSRANYGQALAEWNGWLSLSGATYNSSTQRYDYPNAYANYYYGFARIHVENMIKYGGYSGATLDDLIQHSVSLRSQILSNQEIDSSGNLLGWISDIGNSNSLINTETSSVQILGLSAGGRFAFEAGKSPMQFTANNYFIRSHNVISAVVGLSTAGTPVFGPSMNFPTGPMAVDFYLRSPRPNNTVARIDIYDGATSTVLTSRNIIAAQMKGGNQWTKISLTANITNVSNSLQFRVYWPGFSNLDVAFVQVR
jgi:hypothetical protein